MEGRPPSASPRPPRPPRRRSSGPMSTVPPSPSLAAPRPLPFPLAFADAPPGLPAGLWRVPTPLSPLLPHAAVAPLALPALPPGWVLAGPQLLVNSPPLPGTPAPLAQALAQPLPRDIVYVTPLQGGLPIGSPGPLAAMPAMPPAPDIGAFQLLANPNAPLPSLPFFTDPADDIFAMDHTSSSLSLLGTPSLLPISLPTPSDSAVSADAPTPKRRRPRDSPPPRPGTTTPPRRRRGAQKSPDDIPPHILESTALTLFGRSSLLLGPDELARCVENVLLRRKQASEYSRRARGKKREKMEALEKRTRELEAENRRLKTGRMWERDGYATA